MGIMRGGIIGTQAAPVSGSAIVTTTAGVQSLESLSGIIDLDSPNQSINIATSGQVIQLSAIFTPGSGALLYSLVEGSGVRAINGISGLVGLISTNNGLLVTNNGQVIQLTPLFTYTSGQLIDQNTRDILTVSGMIGTGGGGGGVTSIQGISGVVTLGSPNNSISIVVNGQTIELNSIFTWASGQLLESLVIGSGVRAVNGVSGLLDLVSTNNGLTIAPNGQTIRFTSLFTYASGQYIEGVNQRLVALSGLTDGLPRTQTTVNSVSGTINLVAGNNGIVVDTVGQTISLLTLFTYASGQYIEGINQRLVSLSGLTDGLLRTQTTVNGTSGAVNVVAGNNGVLVDTTGQTISILPLFTYASGQYVEGINQRLVSLSGLTDGLPRTQTTIEGLSGTVNLDSPGNSISIVATGQNIQLEIQPRFLPVDSRQVSGAILPDTTNLYDLGTNTRRWANIYATSGTFFNRPTVSGIPVALLSDLVDTQMSLNGLSGAVTLVAGNNGITITPVGQTIQLTPLFTYASGQIIDQLVQSSSQGSSSGTRKSTMTFTETSGTFFVMQHGLNTLDFVFTMWQGTDDGGIAYTLPNNVYPSGFNHIVVQLDTPMSGKLVLVG